MLFLVAVAVRTLFAKAAKGLHRAENWSWKKKVSSERSQLKIAGTQKCSPFPPLRTPSFPLPKNKECYSSLGGERGHPFAQHCSCPAILRCSIGLTKAAFWGTIFVWEKVLPQSHRAGVNATPVLNRQGGNVLVAATSAVVFLLLKLICILRRSLWSRVLALPPLSSPMNLPAPVADLP